MAEYYDELLKLCGFEDEEINQESPRIKKAFQKVGRRSSIMASLPFLGQAWR